MNNKNNQSDMKKIVLLSMLAVAALVSSVNVSAQGKYGKYGPDSTECLKYLSYYKGYFKQKNYDDATPNWRKAFKFCPPSANQTMLIDGATLLRNLINKNSKNAEYRKALIDSLLMVYDIRVKYYPKYAVTALNNKGVDMTNFVKDNNKLLYDKLKEIIDANKTKTKPTIFMFFLTASVELYKEGVLTAEDVINDYEKLMEYVAVLEASDPSEAVLKLKEDLGNIFISSKVASCENLIALFQPRFDADPNNLELSTNIVRMMSTTENCTDNELFVKAANTMHRLDPSSTSAYFLYRLYSTRDDVESAIKYMEEALGYTDLSNEQKGQYCFELAAFCYKNGKNAKAFESALKAVEFNSELAGKSYMLIGTIWGSQVCPGNEIEKRATYWVAVDYMLKAKNADPSLAEEANKYISQYASYYPQTAEAFMYDVTDGQSYTVSCGGMRATTTVRTQK